MKPVNWYARTSAGIIVVKAGKSLYALKEEDGEQLWMQPVVETTGKLKGSMDAAALRAQDVLEVPGMGVLLLNHAKLKGDKDGRLIALNLTTGRRLWDQPEMDELMTAVPLYENGDVVLVSRRVQKKVLATEMVLAMSSQIPMAVAFLVPYPYRFELARIDLGTGKAKWSTEYERTFTPGTASVKAFGENLFIYFGNKVMTCLNLTDGKLLWEDGKKHLGSGNLVLPMEMANSKLVYSLEYVHAVDPATQKEVWSLEDLGKVSGILVQGGLAIALGDDAMAALDLETGKERWRNRVQGHTTNPVWEKDSDILVYIDGKGLHSVKADTGKALLDTPLRVESWPSYIRLASPEVVVTVAVKEVCAYNFKSGKKLFAEGPMKAFFRSDAYLDNWPMPEDGQEFERMSRPPSSEVEWNALRKGSQLTPEALKSFEAATRDRDFLEAFETESIVETGNVNRTQRAVRKIWWIDAGTNRKVETTPAGEHHDVDRRRGMVFAVNNVQLLGATVSETANAPAQGAPGTK